MDILIETATGKEVNRWSGSPDKVQIPGSGDVVFVGDPDDRPVAIGDSHFLATAVLDEPALGVDQKRGIETVVIVGQAVTINRPAVDLTAQEIADRDHSSDVSELQSSGEQIAFVLVEFVEWALANTAMTAADFSPNTRQVYQDAKTVADRIK